MIGDKEIYIAARAQALSKHINETAYFQLRSIEDFKDGAKWAINEVFKNLSHHASEVPRNDNGKVLAYSKEYGYRKLYDMNDFLSLLPFQKGDKVKDKNGNIFIIERLKDAMSLGKNEIKVHFLIRKIKKNGEPYKDVNEAWGIDYFSLEKVTE